VESKSLTPDHGLKALVTGGAGFIGSHLAQALCRRGVQVVALDNLSTGTLANLEWRRNGDALEFIQGEAGDAALLRPIMPGCDSNSLAWGMYAPRWRTFQPSKRRWDFKPESVGRKACAPPSIFIERSHKKLVEAKA